MYCYMYRTCIGRDPTVQYLKKGIRDTIFGVSYPTFVPRSAAGVLECISYQYCTLHCNLYWTVQLY